MGTTATPNGSEQALAQAHAKVLADKSLQFRFAGVETPPEPPDWLVELMRSIGRAFVAAAPVLKYVFWIGLLALVVLLAWFLLRDLIRIRLSRGQKPVTFTSAEAAWRPERAVAQAVLSDADKLAADGRFAEAARLILTCSIDDFAGRRPGAVRPALTSRDLAQAQAMPPQARGAFSLIVQVVERSLFGGRDVDAEAFGACRRAYHDFALADRWR